MRRVVLSVLVFFAACCTADGINRYTVKDAVARNAMIASTIDGGLGTCAGVIWRTGIIITAKHCVGSDMKANGHPAKVILNDSTDLVVLSALTPEFPDLQISDDVKAGDAVFSVTTFEGFSDLVWLGSVIGVDQTAILSQGQNWPGISGGGLYDSRGRLIGINTKYCCNEPTGKVPLFQLAIHAREVAALVSRLQTPKADASRERP